MLRLGLEYIFLRDIIKPTTGVKREKQEESAKTMGAYIARLATTTKKLLVIG